MDAAAIVGLYFDRNAAQGMRSAQSMSWRWAASLNVTRCQPSVWFQRSRCQVGGRGVPRRELRHRDPSTELEEVRERAVDEAAVGDGHDGAALVIARDAARRRSRRGGHERGPALGPRAHPVAFDRARKSDPVTRDGLAEQQPSARRAAISCGPSSSAIGRPSAGARSRRSAAPAGGCWPSSTWASILPRGREPIAQPLRPGSRRAARAGVAAHAADDVPHVGFGSRVSDENEVGRRGAPRRHHVAGRAAPP